MRGTAYFSLMGVISACYAIIYEYSIPVSSVSPAGDPQADDTALVGAPWWVENRDAEFFFRHHGNSYRFIKIFRQKQKKESFARYGSPQFK